MTRIPQARSALTRTAFLVALAAGAARLEAEERALGKGRVELSAAAALSRVKSPDYRASTTFLSVPVRLGVFASRNFAGEGELVLDHVRSTGRDPSTGVNFAGSALYHFLPQARLVPFLIAGGGIGNGLVLRGTVDGEGDGTALSWHAGAGVKARVGDAAAFRIEYRLTHGMDSWLRLDDHRVLIGLSVFVR